MWDWRTSTVSSGGPILVSLLLHGERATFRAVVEAWQRDDAFRALFTAKMRAIPYQAYCWETPLLSRALLDRPFECVFVESEALAHVSPDPEPFRQHFTEDRSGIDVVSFPSLGRDALLVAPCPRADLSAYTHLAAFVRHAPAQQIHALWRVLAETIETHLDHLDASPTWLSTAGLGVHWLHVRLDSRPKYYRHRPYATDDDSQRSR